MGGSKSGGSSTTTNVPLTQQQYDPAGYANRAVLMKRYMNNLDQGLTDEEKSYYTGTALKQVEDDYANNAKSLQENLARAGIGTNDGAFAESLGNLLRNKYASRAGVYSDVTGKDIAQKNTNMANLINLITNSGAVGSAGSTTTTSGGSSSVKDSLTGAVSGGIGGYSLASALGATSAWPLALGGAILGGIGSLF